MEDFVSKRARGQAGKADFQALAEEHNELQETGGQELQEVRQVGALATRRHAETGEGSFGQPTRQIRRRRERLLSDTTQHLPGVSFTSQLFAASGEQASVSARQDLGPLLAASLLSSNSKKSRKPQPWKLCLCICRC